MNELTRTRTPEIIAAEIRTFTSAMLNNIIEIGRRMVEAKEMLPYGAFGDWIREKTGYSSSTANNFMRLYEEYGAEQGSLFGAEVEDFQTFGKLSYTKALALLAVPAEEREEFVESHDVEAMSTRELQQAIKERDAAKDALAEAREELHDTAEMLDKQMDEYHALQVVAREQKERIQELEDRPVEVAVQEPDPKAVEQAVAKAVAEAEEKHKAEIEKRRLELEKLRKKLEDAEKARDKAKEQASAAGQEAADKLRQEQQTAADEALRYKAEAEDLRKRLAMSGEAVVTFKLHFGAWQKAYEDMQDTLCRMDMLPEAQETKEKLRAAVAAQVKAWGEGV